MAVKLSWVAVRTAYSLLQNYVSSINTICCINIEKLKIQILIIGFESNVRIYNKMKG